MFQVKATCVGIMGDSETYPLLHHQDSGRQYLSLGQSNRREGFFAGGCPHIEPIKFRYEVALALKNKPIKKEEEIWTSL